MKSNLHPTWYHDSVVTCSCGNTFTTGSTTQTMQVDICSACHPFFTGEMRFIDTQGRVDKFMQKMQNAQGTTAAAKYQKKSKSKQADVQYGDAKSYRQLLQEQQQNLKKPAPAKAE